MSKEINKKTNKENNKDVSIMNKLVNQRNIRQEYNNELAYNTIKANPKTPKENNVNKKALNRLLTYTNYNNLNDIIEDKQNYKEIILKLTSLYIAKSASRQGVLDEDSQLENINVLQEYGIIIQKDGMQKPIKGGGIRISDKKQTDELKSIDFIIKNKNKEIGYITAKVSSGKGGHQHNVLSEIIQFCDWSINQQHIDKEQKAYIVLYDNFDTSKLFNSIK